MSAVQKKLETILDAATLDLWRVAENGAVNELASVLARVRDVNARNEHGVTALMRAAQYGHVKIVRALLDHGADANLKRNDKFTALALAAFFGHTEIVRVLMEHGADSKASTRRNTSPQMWATARTFNEVVHQLEKPAAVPKPAAVERPVPLERPALVEKTAPVQRPEPFKLQVAVPAPAPTVVRALKDPPEIWDLVHEEPTGFNARSAFLTRLQSIKTSWAFRMAAVGVLIGVGVVGVMLLSGVQARNEGSSAVDANPAPATIEVRSDPGTTENNSQNATTTPSFETVPAVAPVESGVTTNDQPVTTNRKPGIRWSPVGSPRRERDDTPQVAAEEAVQPVATAPARASSTPRSEPPPKAKTSSPLSPQLIAPAKNAPAKGKVIQWP